MRILPIEPDFSNGFTEENDIFQRKSLFLQIKDVLLTSSDESLVLALDDNWGNGKTAFVKMMEGEIANSADDEINVIYFDAFKNDYQTDPLLAMIASVYEMIDINSFDDDLKSKFVKASKAVVKSILKQSPKAIASILTANTLKDSILDDASGAISTAISDPLDHYIESKITSYKKELDEIQNFKSILKRIHSESQKKTLFIVDELDRAKPDFSLDLLEKIKHLFDVDGFCFLLVLNKDQFIKSIQSRYGKINASLYLNKFVHYWFTLPKVNLESGSDINYAIRYSTIGHYIKSIDNRNVFYSCGRVYVTLVKLLCDNNCSLREAQRCYSVISLIKNSEQIKFYVNEVYFSALALVAYLKVINPELLNSIVNKKISIIEAKRALNLTEHDADADETSYYLSRLLQYHFLRTNENAKDMEYAEIEDVYGRKALIFESIIKHVENMEIR
ncbi:P-loop NTPase fold protein [Providencia stuartii]|uniref:KAP family P-loop NTPase fold protein n=1 Tax=Providencia stuartii TaxID=588 RepID=UPI0015D5B692|nr:P-loop NTPase fold protein [Providencia stuartii]